MGRSTKKPSTEQDDVKEKMVFFFIPVRGSLTLKKRNNPGDANDSICLPTKKGDFL